MWPGKYTDYTNHSEGVALLRLIKCIKSTYKKDKNSQQNYVASLLNWKTKKRNELSMCLQCVFWVKKNICSDRDILLLFILHSLHFDREAL